MNITIRFLSMHTSIALRDHARGRVESHLGRLAQAITHVVVRVRDINGPTGGVDKVCSVTVRGSKLGLLTVEELSSDPYAAVDAALARMSSAVARGIERARSSERGHLTRRSA